MLHEYFHVSGQSASLSKGNFSSSLTFLLLTLQGVNLEPYVVVQKTRKLISRRAKCLQSRVGTFPFAFLRAFIYFPKY